MTTDLARTSDAAIMERVIIAGDLSKLAPQERVSYYRATCESLGLNPLTLTISSWTTGSRCTPRAPARISCAPCSA